MEDKLLETIAKQAHQTWVHWHKYMTTKCEVNKDGSYTIPPYFAERWNTRSTLAYEELSEEERDSDRIIAKEYLKVFLAYLQENYAKGKDDN